MKTIGIIGGVGWPSTIDYYRLISEKANEHFQDFSCPPILIHSLNFEAIKALHFKKDWQGTVPILADAIASLERAGADVVLIASGTTNIPSDQLSEGARVPFLHIVEPTARAIQSRGLKKVLLLGTKPTMEEAFFRESLSRFGIEAVVPDEVDRQRIHDIIYKELCSNLILPESKAAYLDVIRKLHQEGAEGVILGCTEIPLLVSEADLEIPVFNMSKLHAEAALEFALSEVSR